MTPARIAAHLAECAAWAYSRSSGPGGQRRDHAETRAELTVRAEDLHDLPGELAGRLCTRLGLAERPLRLASQAQRSRERNREAVIARLERRIADALAPPPPLRRPTRPSAAARRRRLDDKARHGDLKRSRRQPEVD